MYYLIRKLCSRSISVITDNIVGNILEVLFNYLYNHRENSKSLLKFIEYLDHKLKVLKTIGFKFVICKSYTINLRNKK